MPLCFRLLCRGQKMRLVYELILPCVTIGSTIEQQDGEAALTSPFITLVNLERIFYLVKGPSAMNQ